ncbi:MAG: prepilin-type N-terminal cleavage/methylation domain-containing protein [Opitutales bacterium]|nr:prepilin-type N-terminal cleavage/methylation domain-containing protein [Opitutales bacterium]
MLPRYPQYPFIRTGGFTLIELLTVIAIIGILAGILVPVIGRVRDSARTTESAANIRQLGLANTVYANDNRDQMVPHGNINGEFYNWAAGLAEYIDLDPEHIRGPGRPPGILAAPGSAWEMDEGATAEDYVAVSDYVMNANFAGEIHYLTHYRNPKRILLFVTAGHDENVPRETGPWVNNSLSGTNRVVNGVRLLHQRGKAGVAVYLDGSAGVFDPAPHSSNSTYPWNAPAN